MLLIGNQQAAQAGEACRRPPDERGDRAAELSVGQQLEHVNGDGLHP